MRKLVAMLLCALMMTGSFACADGVDIGYCVPDTTSPFLGWLTTTVQELAAAEGYTVQIADAGGSVATQLTQIENFTTMGVKVIAVVPVDPESVIATVEKAHNSGIKTMTAGGDTGIEQGIWDCVVNADQTMWGQQCAILADKWAKEKGFHGSKVLVIEYKQTPEAEKRCTGITTQLRELGYEVVVAPAEALTAAESKTVMENLWLQNSDATVICTYGTDAAVGVNEFLMGFAGVDLENVGVFTCETSTEIEEMINASTTNASVLRGTTGISGPTIGDQAYPLPEGLFLIMKKLMDGSYNYDVFIRDAIREITPQ